MNHETSKHLKGQLGPCVGNAFLIMEVIWDPVLVFMVLHGGFMVSHGFWLVFMVFHGFYGFWLVSMVFQGSFNKKITFRINILRFL